MSASVIVLLDTSYADVALFALLASIAEEVQARTAWLCDSIEVEFAGRIRLARTTLPCDYVATTVNARLEVAIPAP